MPEVDSAAVSAEQASEAPEQIGAPPASRKAVRGPRTFGRRLALAFATVAALTAILAGALLSVAWSYQFNEYVRDNLQRFADGVATITATYYPAYGFGYQTLSQIPMLGETSNVGVQVLDVDGMLVYDEATMRKHMQAIITQGGAIQPSLVATEANILRPNGPVATAAIKVNGQTVGSVRVWAYGRGALMTDRDTQFRQGSFMGLFIAAIAAIILASIAGALYSRRLVQPIQRITATAEALRGGDQDARTRMDADDEIGFLGKTFDEMADSIEADRAMERRLTADVAHELRTPLQAIQATVEAMQDGVLPADEEHLGIVRDETVRLGRLAGGILELTRLERGSLVFRCERIDVAVPVRAALDAHLALLETCDVSATSSFQDSLFANIDSDRLQQAVGNLLSNAARYTPAGGSVHVSVLRDGDCALIEVADTGIGIAEEDMTQVFSRFWRADSARDRSSGGIGIGLAVTKEIIERMRGTIGVRAQVSGGTVFSIRLPLA
ncbi:MAG: HAMP domain-containing histidine kinase [Coriobacteriia bacterium]|nr:HAMP domain-containing histidine kinase [Coriobacteriia bacterium]